MRSVAFEGEVRGGARRKRDLQRAAHDRGDADDGGVLARGRVVAFVADADALCVRAGLDEGVARRDAGEAALCVRLDERRAADLVPHAEVLWEVHVGQDRVWACLHSIELSPVRGLRLRIQHRNRSSEGLTAWRRDRPASPPPPRQTATATTTHSHGM